MQSTGIMAGAFILISPKSKPDGCESFRWLKRWASRIDPEQWSWLDWRCRRIAIRDRAIAALPAVGGEVAEVLVNHAAASVVVSALLVVG
jgi:hypothetical protein